MLTNLTMGMFFCFTGGDWAVDLPEGGSMWYGFGIESLIRLVHRPELQNMSLVTKDINLANFAVETALNLVASGADFTPAIVPFNHQLLEHIDYSYPLYFGEKYHILSASNATFNGNIVSGVFDKTSYTLVLLASVILAILFTISAKKSERSALDSLIAFCLIFYQPLPSSAQNQISSGSWIRRFIAGLIYLHSLFFVLMYNSVIISMLSRQDLVDKIDHVDDLINKYTDKMIYVVENGVEDQAFSTGPLAHRLIRHPLIKPPELMETYYQNIKDGTHVGVIYPTIMEMDVDIQPQLRGKITRFDFRYSRYPVVDSMNPLFGWMYRKNFPLRELFDYHLTRVASVGLMVAQDSSALRMFYNNPTGLYLPRAKQLDTCPSEPIVLDEASYREKPKAERRPPFSLAWNHVQLAFAYLGIGLALGFLVFLFEKGYHTLATFNI